MHVVSATEDTHIDGLGRDMSVDNAGDDDLYGCQKPALLYGVATYCRKRNAISNFGHNRAGGSQCGRSNCGSPIAVDHDGCNEIEGHIDALQQHQGFGIVGWIFQFRCKAKECSMSSYNRISLTIKAT